jgi:hypothetical protein
LSELPPNIRIVSAAGGDGTLDDTPGHGGKVRIVMSESTVSPRKVVSISQQPQFSTARMVNQERPKVVIRPALAPKAESKVQYVRVMGSKPAQQVTIDTRIKVR